jgi:hypothetical protein
VDADRPDRVVALTEGQGISIGTPPRGLQKMPVDPIEIVDSPALPPLWQVFGGRLREDGHWRLPTLAVEVASPDAAVQASGIPAPQAISSHVMFLSRGKVGPFRVDTEAMTGPGGDVAVRTLLHDEAHGGRAITVGSYHFRNGES